MICDIAGYKFRYLHNVQTFERITRSYQETSESQYQPDSKRITQIHKILEEEYVVHVFGLFCYTFHNQGKTLLLFHVIRVFYSFKPTKICRKALQK